MNAVLVVAGLLSGAVGFLMLCVPDYNHAPSPVAAPLWIVGTLLFCTGCLMTVLRDNREQVIHDLKKIIEEIR